MYLLKRVSILFNFLLLSVALVWYLSGTSYACDICSTSSPPTCIGDRLYECVSCNSSCFYRAPSGNYWKMNDSCPQDASPARLVYTLNAGWVYLKPCDESCSPARNGPQYWNDIGPCCIYSNNPVCSDDISVKISGTNTEVSCASGVIDIYISNVQDAETVRFPVWTEENGQDDLVWYDATYQGGGVWKTTVDLEDHAGTGTVYIDAYAGNCYSGSDIFCGRHSIEKVAEPSCPRALYQDLHCGATSQEATFSWWAANSPALDAYVLRVNHFDNVDPEWYNDGTDRWVWVAKDEYPPCGLNWTLWGPLWQCTLSNLAPGDYLDWSVQAVDGCNNYQGNCIKGGDSFTCQNEAPTCSNITGPSEVISGSTVTFSTTVRDSVDSVAVTWSASYGGSFSPETQSYPSAGVASTANTSWTSVDLPITYNASDDSWVTNPVACTISAVVDDTDLTTTCQKNVTVRAPTISGRLFQTSASAPCVGSGGSLLFADSPEFHFYYTEGYSASSPVDTSSGAYSLQALAGVQLTSATLFDADLNPPVDTRYEALCYNARFSDGSPVPDLAVSGLGVSRSTGVPLLADLDLDIGYVLNSVMDYGWFTSLDAPVYSGSGLTGMIVSSAPEYPGIDEAYMTSHYAFSPSAYNVSATEEPTNRIAEGGYAQNTGEVFHFSFDSVEDSDAQYVSIQDLGEATDPDVIYAIGSQEFDRDINDPDRPMLNYGTIFEKDGVVVVFIDGDPDRETVEFRQSLKASALSSQPNRRYLFVTNLPVIFSPDVGQPRADADEDTWALPDGSADIEASIFTSSTVSFPSRISPNDVDNPDVQDSTITIDGSLIAGGAINMSRDLNLWNTYPAVVVKYNPMYLVYLQRQLEVNSDFQRLFLSLVSISWDIDE